MIHCTVRPSQSASALTTLDSSRKRTSCQQLIDQPAVRRPHFGVLRCEMCASHHTTTHTRNAGQMPGTYMSMYNSIANPERRRVKSSPGAAGPAKPCLRSEHTHTHRLCTPSPLDLACLDKGRHVFGMQTFNHGALHSFHAHRVHRVNPPLVVNEKQRRKGCDGRT